MDAILLLINKSANASFGHKKACHDAVQPDEHGGRREGHKARFGSLAAEAKDAGANGGPANEGGHAKERSRVPRKVFIQIGEEPLWLSGASPAPLAGLSALGEV